MRRETQVALRLVASKQSIVSMGYPEIVSKILYERFGNLAPLIAKWFRQYKNSGEKEISSNWWSNKLWSMRDEVSLWGMTYLYERATTPESFKEAAEFAGVPLRRDYLITQEVVNEQRVRLVEMIRNKLFDETFFTYYILIQDIMNGKLTDIAPYKKLSFQDAVMKYDRRRFFSESSPIRVYKNGFKWIDTGKKSALLSEQMKNCGSAGVMSMDKDRTILTLFGPNNKPHVMVTYSPNEKRISGDECAGSSPVKTEYHDYVLDLTHTLGVRFDVERTKSPFLKLKYLLRNKATHIEELSTGNGTFYDVYFRFVYSGQVWYTDGYYVISERELNKLQRMIDSGELSLRYQLSDLYKSALNHMNRDNLTEHGIGVVSLHRFLED